jgi:radical SAM superfamily enzyme YgiQ (UPF0313 family)
MGSPINMKESSNINFETGVESNIRIWLIDPTYTQQQQSSYAMPSAIGGIATFTDKYVKKLKNPVRVFKYPEKLADALKKEGPPEIIGLSNYVWNHELSRSLASRIKTKSPKTITVMGGPNYPVETSEQESYLQTHPEIDFFVVGEGELAFANLVASLIRDGLDKNKINETLPSVHFLKTNKETHITSIMERIEDLTQIPSPYLEGKLDEFFDGRLQPVIQTTRGCPFACTFCVEGTHYYQKVYRSSQDRTSQELDYIGYKMQMVREKGGRNDLWVVDSNFGMYTQDLETCKSIAECQEKYNWPEYIQCDTGKNQKPRVLSAARLVKGAMQISGSVQTLDEEVLKNIKRNNIATDGLMELAVEAAEIDADSRSEIILALPGETLESHFETIRKVIDSGLSHVNTYQLMMLPGTEMGSPGTREKYQMETRYRVLSRCFGYYDILGEIITAAEIEEICVSTNTLSFEDYVKCRKMHLIIHIFYNDRLFKSVLKIISYLGLSAYTWLKSLYDDSMEGDLRDVFNEFEKHTREELFIGRKKLENKINHTKTIDSYIKGEMGYSLIPVFKGIAMTNGIDGLKAIAKKTLHQQIKLHNMDKAENLDFIDDALKFDGSRISNIFHNMDSSPAEKMNFDIGRFIEDKEPKRVKEYRFEKDKTIKFNLDDSQKDIIERSIALYGKDKLGIARALTKLHMKRLLRKPDFVFQN